MGEIYLSNLSGQFDYEAILAKYQELGTIQANNYFSKEQEQLTKKSALDSYKSMVESFKSAFSDMSQDDLLIQKKVTVSDESVLKATITDATKAQEGFLDVEVKQLAQQDIWLSQDGVASTSDAVATANGTLEIKYGGSVVATIDYDTDTGDSSKPSTLSEIADAINSAQDKVKATIFYDGTNYRLLLKGADTGAANTIELSETGSGDLIDRLKLNASDGANVQAAQDAVVSIYGSDVVSSTNSFENVLDGISFEVFKTGTANIEVANDDENVIAKIQGFVDNFNALVDYEKEQTQEGAPLAGDLTMFQVRSTFVRNFDPLFKEGIASIDREGKVSLDTSKLSDLLQNDRASVEAMLDDLKNRFEPLFGLTVEEDGILPTKLDALQKSADRYDEEALKILESVDREIERLRDQFVQLDSFMAQMQDVQNRLAAILPQSQ